jgi:hypothetical protein
VEGALESGLRTPDLSGGAGTREAGTEQMTAAVLERLT